ncbi:Cof-type HAD-IIB family hydrolase [Brevibacillus humidisoli]|uniref:Cof-type HAD-IIB family hydrolase n=1 Tax=Brevibacillus humidisoli TaxID=2895522 RepID=UPI001E39D19C|nr:Cof-type HAD-IIB family hydrolase [Brevibacillus humidisoli]UFJ39831.1 Cof-type HAD-IIB family hydrolase [Brevibacillus humidisoli]
MPYNIVFFDIDGTLLDSKNEIPEDTKQAVAQLKETGTKVAIATGRSPYHLKPVADQLGIDTYVSFNGSYVVEKETVVYTQPLKKESLSLLEERARSYDHPLVYLSEEDCYANAEDHPRIIESFHYLSLQPPDYHHCYWQEKEIYQAFLYCQPHEETAYLEDLADFSSIRWHPYALDILPGGGSKAKGIAALLKHLGLSAEEAVAFGDGLNDIEMLSFVGMGIAMGNAHEDLKPYAKWVTRDAGDGGIRHGLQQIGLIS